MPVTPKERPILEVMKDLPQQAVREQHLATFLCEATGLIRDLRVLIRKEADAKSVAETGKKTSGQTKSHSRSTQ